MASPTGKTEGGGGGPTGKSRAGRQQFSRKILNTEGHSVLHKRKGGGLIAKIRTRYVK